MFLLKRKRGFRVAALLIAFLTAFSSLQLDALAQTEGTVEAGREAATLVTYPAPDKVALNNDYFAVKVRAKGTEAWEDGCGAFGVGGDRKHNPGFCQRRRYQ